MKQSTSFKVAFGYILLTCLLLGTIRYIYIQIQSLTQTTVSEQALSIRRKATHQLICRLFEVETVGQAVRLGNKNFYRAYEKALADAQVSILGLDSLFTDTIQQARLDTLSMLLQSKKNNMQQLLRFLKNNPAPHSYQQQLQHILTRKDSLDRHPQTTRKIIQHKESYTVQKNKRNFFQRLADAFRPQKKDTTAVSQQTQILAIDTLDTRYNPADTLAHLLNHIENEVQKTRTQHTHRINRQEEKLHYTSIELSYRVAQLLESIEEEEQRWLQSAIRKEQQLRHGAALTLGVISIMAILLAVVFFILVRRDINRSNHYRKELERAKEKAESLLVSREKLMLTITHDIKAPVGSILGYLELLLPDLTEKKKRFYAENMRNSAEHLLNLVNSLLDYHRLEAGKTDIQTVSFSPHDLVYHICQSFLPLIEKKGLQFVRELPENHGQTYQGDASHIRQIIENVLSNALKFTSQGQISLKAQLIDSHLHIAISDTGCGMTPDEQKQIFQEFTRLRSAQGQEGFGLGLSITQKLIQLLGGKLQIESAENKGTTFYIVLPLQMAKPSAPDAPRLHLIPADRNLRILVIDDDRIQLQLTRNLLERLQQQVTASPSWTVVTCQHPEEMFHYLKTDLFDLLFTDIQMPALNGFELLKQIRQLPENKNATLPVIALTARTDMSEKDFQQQGFLTCLYKPFSIDELTRSIRKVLHSPAPDVSATVPIPGTCPEKQPDLCALTTFADGDEAAIQEILHTFLRESLKHEEELNLIIASKNKAALCRLAHKLLPTFSLLGSGITETLQNLDRQKNKGAWQAPDETKTDIIRKGLQQAIQATKLQLNNKNI